jgi:hypothetical protein
MNLTPEQVQKIRRRIIDWLHKYATPEQVREIAERYNIKTD